MFEVSLGAGEFGWHASERRCGRYGSVGLFGEKGRIVLDAEQIRFFSGFSGYLKARKLAACNVGHVTIRDNVAVGATVTLCSPGKVFLHEVKSFNPKHLPDIPLFWGPYVGIEPLEPRDESWMDTEALYAVDDTQVELFLVLPNLPPSVTAAFLEGHSERARILAQRLGVLPVP